MIKKLISAIFGSSKPVETNSTLPATISRSLAVQLSEFKEFCTPIFFAGEPGCPTPWNQGV